MDLLTGIFLYFLIWWTTIFTVLNIGHRAAENPETGHAKSAPAQFNLGQKVLLNSAVAGGVWLVIYLIVTYGGFSFTEAVASWN